MRTLFLVLIVLATWPVDVSRAAAQPHWRPNVIVILSDDHGTQSVSGYGSTLLATPGIDRLAAEGARLDRAFVTNSLCAPSRATLLTGKYAHRHGYPDNARGRLFDGSQPTLPKLMQAAGYETAIFGKWHLRSDPTGFDRWLVIDGVARYFGPKFKDPTGSREIPGYSNDTIFNAAIEWTTSRPGTAEKRPFFMVVAPNAPHRNWTPDEKHAGLFAGDLPLPATFDDDLSTRTSAAREARMRVLEDLRKNDVKADPPEGLSPAERKRWKFQRFAKDYLRCVAALDAGIVRLLDHLDRTGLAGNTLVIYTSDNGFFLGEHGWFDKRFMYEPSIRVPFVARLPGAIPPGTTSEALSLNVDTAPTILDFAGAAIPGDMQGRSLRPILEGRGTPEGWRRSLYYRFYEREDEHNVAPHRGLRTETHKLIHFLETDEWELYDLVADPHELNNLADEPAHAGLRKALSAELDRLAAELGDPPAATTAPARP